MGENKARQRVKKAERILKTKETEQADEQIFKSRLKKRRPSIAIA